MYLKTLLLILFSILAVTVQNAKAFDDNKICQYVSEYMDTSYSSVSKCSVEDSEGGKKLLIVMNAEKKFSENFTNEIVYNDENVQNETKNVYCKIFSQIPEFNEIHSVTEFNSRKLITFKLTKNICTSGITKNKKAISPKEVLVEQCIATSAQIKDSNIEGAGCYYSDDVFVMRYNVKDGLSNSSYTERKAEDLGHSTEKKFCGEFDAIVYLNAGFRTLKFIYQRDNLPFMGFSVNLEHCVD